MKGFSSQKIDSDCLQSSCYYAHSTLLESDAELLSLTVLFRLSALKSSNTCGCNRFFWFGLVGFSFFFFSFVIELCLLNLLHLVYFSLILEELYQPLSLKLLHTANCTRVQYSIARLLQTTLSETSSFPIPSVTGTQIFNSISHICWCILRPHMLLTSNDLLDHTSHRWNPGLIESIRILPLSSVKSGLHLIYTVRSPFVASTKLNST